MKNKFMRLAAIMLVLVLATSCFVGGTFAKYVTSGEGSDSARVAKFGVTVTGTNNSAFGMTYAKDSGTEIANTVVSTEYVVAPGTKGELASFEIEGTPEVAVEVAYEATVDFGDNWVDADGNYYCPINITVGSLILQGLDYVDKGIEAFENDVKAEIEKCTDEYEAGVDLSTAAVPAISWAWDFENVKSQVESEITYYDVEDTFLGDQAAAGNAATISITTTATVTQID